MAVTHRSFRREVPNNETLEFLGDAVLALAIADLLMRRFPSAREGELSKLRAGLVNAGTLAQKARSLELGRWLRLGKGEEKSGGRDKESILAAAYEAGSAPSTSTAGTTPRAAGGAPFAHDLADEASAGAARLQDPSAGADAAAVPCHARSISSSTRGARSRQAVRRRARRSPAGVLGRGVGHSKKTAEQAAAMEALDAITRDKPGRRTA